MENSGLFVHIKCIYDKKKKKQYIINYTIQMRCTQSVKIIIMTVYSYPILKLKHLNGIYYTYSWLGTHVLVKRIQCDQTDYVDDVNEHNGIVSMTYDDRRSNTDTFECRYNACKYNSHYTTSYKCLTHVQVEVKVSAVFNCDESHPTRLYFNIIMYYYHFNHFT